jgi:putative MATE family efflux protein
VTLHQRIVALSVPAAATLIADPLLGIVDTAVVGRIGSVELGALGLAVGLLASVSWVFNFLVYGTTAVVSRAVGAGDGLLAGRRIVHAAQVAVLVGIIVAVVLITLADSVVELTGAASSLRSPAADYLRIRAVGVPFLLLSYVGHGAHRGLSDTRAPLAFVVVANVVNALLDVVLVLVLDFGLAGAAWATVAAEVIVVALFATRVRRLPVVLRGHGRPGRDDVRSLLVVGRDLVIRTGALLLSLLAMSVATARVGPVVAAAHQLLFSTWIFVSALLDGVAIAGQALVGTALGRGDPAEAKRVAATLVRWAFGSGVAVAAVLLPLGFVVPGLLTSEPEVVTLATSVWWLASACHVFSGGAFVLDGVLMGAGDFGWLRSWAVIAAAASIALIVFVEASGGGLLPLWVAFETMVAVRVVANVARVRAGRWAVPGASL